MRPVECLSDEVASAFVYGSLSTNELDAVEEHLDTCTDCAELVAALGHVTEPARVEGDHIGRYQIIGLLGTGAMSVVYEAHDPELDRRVAIKLMRTEDTSESGRRRLLAEARAMARLKHPNVITVHDVGAFAGEVFVAMERVQGCTLRQWLAAEKRTTAAIVEALVAAGRGLEAAHQAGLVHRDVKPDNVLVGEDGRVLVTDFGLVGAETEQASDASVVGTPAYMAPEQLRGETRAASDQFSFCVMLHEALTGRRPNLPIVPAAVREHISPRWIGRILARGLSPVPEQRYRSMGVLLDELAVKQRTRRRARVAIVAAVGAIAASAIAWWATRDDASTACADVGAELDAAWNDARRGQIAQTFAARGARFADDAWKTVSSRIDAHGRAWLTARAQLCEDSRRRRRPPDVLALTGACLAERLDELDALLHTLANGDDVTIRNSVDAASALPPVERCLDPAELQRRARGGDGGGDEAVREVRRQLAGARILHDVGRYADGLALLTAVPDRAAELSDTHTQARALHLRCALLARTGKPADAEVACHEAAMVSAREGHARETADAWITLVTIVGGDQARFKDAELWAGYADAAIRRAGRAPELEAALHGALGIIAKSQARYDEALAHYTAAVDKSEALYGEVDLRVARTLNNLAILEGVMGKTGDARAHHLRSLSIKQELYGGYHPSVAVSLVNLGLLDSGTDNDRAREHFLRALDIARANHPPTHPTIAAIHGNLGLLEYRSGRYGEAEEQHERALELFAANFPEEHPRIASTVDNLGLVFRATRRHAEALRAHHRALAIRQKLYAGDHDDIASSYNNIGLVLTDQGKPREALAILERGLAIRERVHGKEHRDLAWDLAALGNAHLADGAPRTAMPILERARSLLRAEDGTPALVADVSFTLARASWDGGGDREQAIEHARRALAIYESSGDPSKTAAAVRAWLASRTKK
jgi:tetratricopeptide (TPR) repeat protein/predicted Ser/Thr protein kinase